MYFLDTSFFTGDIHIPNLEETCVTDMQFFKLIAKWERECLELVLGRCLTEELLNQFRITGEDGAKKYMLKSEADIKWKHLIEGRTYSQEDVSNYSGCICSDCDTHTWSGFVTKTPVLLNGLEVEFKESFLAYYVYYMWTFDNASRTTGTGERLPEAKNSVSVSPKAKRIAAWNYFYSMVRGCSSTGAVGLYAYLNENAELFPTWAGANIQNQNIYGI